MTENAEKVWNYLLGRKCRMTARQISVGTGLKEKEVGQAIGELRHIGVLIVSMPGRSNAGYLINDGAKEISEAWINNWRSSRGLAATFSYANSAKNISVGIPEKNLEGEQHNLKCK